MRNIIAAIATFVALVFGALTFTAPNEALAITVVNMQADSVEFTFAWTAPADADLTHYEYRIAVDHAPVQFDMGPFSTTATSVTFKVPRHQMAYNGSGCVKAVDAANQPSGEPCTSFSVAALDPPPGNPTNLSITAN